MDVKRRERSVNFSDKELRILLEFVKDHSKTLYDKLCSNTTAKKKRVLWQSIADDINARGTASRTVQQLKKKWSDLRSSAIAWKRKAQNPVTGGGEKEEEPWFVNLVLDIIGGEDNCTITGIPGGGDSLAQSMESLDKVSISEDDEVSRELDSIIQLDEQEESFNEGQEQSKVQKQSTSKRAASGDMDQVAQLKAKKSKKNGDSNKENHQSGRMRNGNASDLTKEEIERLKLEKTKLVLEIDWLKVQNTNAKLKQVKLLIEMRKLEQELGLPAVVMGLDIAIPEKINDI